MSALRDAATRLRALADADGATVHLDNVDLATAATFMDWNRPVTVRAVADLLDALQDSADKFTRAGGMRFGCAPASAAALALAAHITPQATP